MHGGRKFRAVVFRHFSQFSVTFRKIRHHLERVVVSESLVCADRLGSPRAFKRTKERYTSEHTISKCIFRRRNSASFRYSRTEMSNVVLLQGAVFAVSVSVTLRIFGSLFIVLRHFSQVCVTFGFTFAPTMPPCASALRVDVPVGHVNAGVFRVSGNRMSVALLRAFSSTIVRRPRCNPLSRQPCDIHASNVTCLPNEAVFGTVCR